MKRATCSLVSVLLFASAVPICSQEVVVDFCVPEECRATDPDCCVEDTLEIVFPDAATADSSVLEYDEFVVGTRFEIAVVTETRSEDVQLWSFAVKHDPKYLVLVESSVTTDGTDVAERARFLGVTVPVSGGTAIRRLRLSHVAGRTARRTT